MVVPDVRLLWPAAQSRPATLSYTEHGSGLLNVRWLGPHTQAGYWRLAPKARCSIAFRTCTLVTVWLPLQTHAICSTPCTDFQCWLVSHTPAVLPALRSPVELCDARGASTTTQDGDAHVVVASQGLQLLHNPPALLQTNHSCEREPVLSGYIRQGYLGHVVLVLQQCTSDDM